ncbi:MAG: glycosyltransferase family 2 protein [Thermoleophilaceae bacterium]|nr:glycosyltransferase family 2 protein [Thermoleophilaceae bacterium]
MGGGIWAIVVTYNRRELLRECLAALAVQSRAIDRVFVVDNASTDGTAAMVRDEYADVELLALPTNQGGAGGFHEGMNRAYLGGAEWLWLMDDDTISRPDTLEELLAAAERATELHPLVLASKAVWMDGHLHPMNVPGFERERLARIVGGAEHGVMPVTCATFVSLLVRREAIERYGLPAKHFFLWSDDIEYTNRVLREDTGFLVPTSVVEHRTRSPHTAMTAPPERFYFHVRNTLYMLRSARGYPKEAILLAWVLVSSIAVYLSGSSARLRALPFIARGLRDGLRRLPPESTRYPFREREQHAQRSAVAGLG